MSERAAVDVVVAGGGGAGLTAALSAAAAGASVLVVEARRTWQFDSNTAMSTSMIPGAGSSWQRRACVEDSPQLFLDDVVRKTGGSVDLELARALTGVSAELVEWLASEVKVPLELATDFVYPGHSVARCHTVPDRSGMALLAALVRRCQELEQLTVVAPRRLTEVARGPGGSMACVKLEAPDGTREEVECRGVVLATNGFGANRELVAKYIPQMAEALYFGGAGSTGDGLRIGTQLGADLAYMDAYQGHGSVAVPQGILVTWATMMHGGILVNCEGRRFGDETVGYSEYAACVLSQERGEAWAVFDQRIDRLCLVFADHRRLAASGAIRWASSVEELAQATGVDRQGLEVTLEIARECALGKTKDPLGRLAWEATLQPPFAAVRVTGALFHTQGGLRVDGRSRVLDSSGAAVPGLFAAGGTAMGISGHGAAGYLAGNGLLGALGLGYIAGREAASCAC